MKRIKFLKKSIRKKTKVPVALTSNTNFPTTKPKSSLSPPTKLLKESQALLKESQAPLPKRS